MPVKTVAKSSAATPAAPKAMPEAALQSHVLAFAMEDIIHSSQSIQESRVKGKKDIDLRSPLCLSLWLYVPSWPPPRVFLTLWAFIYNLVTSQKQEGRRD